MEYRILGHTSLKVSRTCLGTMTFGDQTDETAAASMVDASFEAGVNFIDTANKYSDGRSEEILGRILRGRRDKAILASKVFGRMGPGPDESGLSRAAIFRAVEDSLRRLQTDYLDIYYLHQPDDAVALEETLAAMDQLIRDGKVRYLAASNYASWQICRMRWLAETHGFQPVGITQPMYNLLARGIEQEFLPMCREFNVATVVYNPLAGGLLTGKHQPAAPMAGTRFDRNQMYVDRYWYSSNFDAVKRLQDAIQDHGPSLVSVSLNWLLHHTSIDCIILGASQQEQLVQNLAVIDEGPLSEQLLEDCDRLWRDVRGASPQYNR